jgi:chondroitin synthase
VSIFSKAKCLFDKGEYAKALELYENAGETYGREIVQYNIDRCKEALVDSFKLDKVTKLSVQTGEAKSKELLNHHDSLDKVSGEVSTGEYSELIFTSMLPFDDSNAPEALNDFSWYKKLLNKTINSQPALSVVIPTFNRTRLLSITLASLVIQRTNYNFEVIVADDGSSENIVAVVREFESKLDLKYVRQQDKGYQLCAIRNLGLRAAKYPYVAILDCDMAPDESWVESYIEALIQNEDTAYIGPRKYIDTSTVSCNEIIVKKSRLREFAEIPAKEALGRIASNGVSKDWRLKHFAETDSLRLSRFPFRFFSCGNVAFAKKWLDKVGWFDEEFSDWGGEDNEFGYRLFRAGCFFQSLEGAMAFHQEPPGTENETDRDAGKKITSEIVVQKVPVFYRKAKSIKNTNLFETSLLSIIIIGSQTTSSIKRLVSTILNQTVVDLQVQIFSEYLSTDTLDFVNKKFSKNTRVRIIDAFGKGNEPTSLEEQINSSNSYYICFISGEHDLPPNAFEHTLELLADKNDLNYVSAADDASGKTVFKIFSSRVYNILKNIDKPNIESALMDLKI